MQRVEPCLLIVWLWVPCEPTQVRVAKFACVIRWLFLHDLVALVFVRANLNSCLQTECPCRDQVQESTWRRCLESNGRA